MFKKSKRKIVAVIMLLLIIVFITIIGVIYITTCNVVYKNNQNLLEKFTEDYIEEWQITEKPTNKGDKLVKSTVFYVVILKNDGYVTQILNDIKPIMNDTELIDMATNILNSDKSEGMLRKVIYRVIKKDGLIYITFMKNTIISDSITGIFENASIFGAITLIFLFVISLKLADKIVNPLEENYKKQKQFISDAGHELKTPISTISANSEMLERQIGDNKWLSNIRFETNRMQKLIEQLLELARMESISTTMETINLSRIILGGILPFESIAFEKGYMINNEIEDNIYVSGNKEQLGQLVAILTDNALSHAEGKGIISVTFKCEYNMSTLSISNPGKEIPLEEHENIFERFYKVDESRSLEGHYGLGLAIAKTIVNSHNGKISVQSKNGITTFIVKIPKK